MEGVEEEETESVGIEVKKNGRSDPRGKQTDGRRGTREGGWPRFDEPMTRECGVTGVGEE